MTEQFVNFVAMHLVGGCSSSNAQITVAPFDQLPSTGTFRLLIDAEIVQVVEVFGSGVLGVVRGQEGTVAKAHADQTAVIPIVTAAGVNQMIADILALAIGTSALDVAANPVDADLDLSTARVNTFCPYAVAFTAPRTLKLPTTPQVGQKITATDIFAAWGTQALTIDAQGLGNIGGFGTTMTIATTGVSVVLQWTGVSWAVVSYVDPTLPTQLAALQAQVNALAAGTGFTLGLSHGAILYSPDGTTVAALPVGGEFQVLKSNGSVPGWSS